MNNTLDKLCMGCFTQLSAPNTRCPVCGYVPPSDAEGQHRLAPRTVLSGKYMVGKPLGEGGFGITYLGYDLNLDIKVAIKEFYPFGFVTRSGTQSTTVQPLAGEQGEFFLKGRERFVDEAKRLAKFRTFPGIVMVNDFFVENGTAYIVMEYVEGETLKSYMAQQGGRLPAEMVLTMPAAKRNSIIAAAVGVCVVIALVVVLSTRQGTPIDDIQTDDPGESVGMASPELRNDGGDDTLSLQEASANDEDDKDDHGGSEALNELYSEMQAYIDVQNLSDSIALVYNGDFLLLTLSSDIFFEFEKPSAQIAQEMMDHVVAIADMLDRTFEPNDPFEIVVGGHTDNVPINTQEYPSNWQLSEDRAVNILNVLIDESGLDSTLFYALSYGETNPAASNDTAEGRARNRRVEIMVSLARDNHLATHAEIEAITLLYGGNPLRLGNEFSQRVGTSDNSFSVAVEPPGLDVDVSIESGNEEVFTVERVYGGLANGFEITGVSKGSAILIIRAGDKELRVMVIIT